MTGCIGDGDKERNPPKPTLGFCVTKMTQTMEKTTPTTRPISTLMSTVAAMATSQTTASALLTRHLAGTSRNFRSAPRRLTMMMQARTHFWRE